MRRLLTALAMLAVGLVADGPKAIAEQTGHVDSSNIGVAVEDAVISSGLPNANLDVRIHSEFGQQLLNTTADSDYPTAAAGASAQEYMIFKFDFASLPPGAEARSPVWFDFSAWFTVGEETEDEKVFGRFEYFEIVFGDPNWQDRHFDESTENPTPVTWNSLAGTFVELSGVAEDNTDPPDNTTGRPFGQLYPGLLVSNGGFDGANRIIGIPVGTINRLISGESVGLAIGSAPPAVSEVTGDYDRDGAVDGSDFLLWQQQLGSSVPPGSGADGSGNGTVDGEDIALWRTNFGSAPSPSEGTTNFSITTTEHPFTHPLSSPTLNFDWSAPDAVNAVPEPDPRILSLFAILLTSVLPRR